jgi:hypothetical protein
MRVKRAAEEAKRRERTGSTGAPPAPASVEEGY